MRALRHHRAQAGDAPAQLDQAPDGFAGPDGLCHGCADHQRLQRGVEPIAEREEHRGAPLQRRDLGFGAQEALYLLGSGGLVAFANFLYIDALRTGAISVVAPFRYTAAIWASIAGFMVWGDIPDALGLLGTFFIIGSGLYTFYRELEVAKARRATPPLAFASIPDQAGDKLSPVTTAEER